MEEEEDEEEEAVKGEEEEGEKREPQRPTGYINISHSWKEREGR